MSKFKVLGKLFSKTDEALDALKREKGTGAEFLKELEKTLGVKPQEIKDRKLDKVLPSMGKTTKAEVKKVLEQNPPPKLQEEVLGGRDDWRIRLDLLENRGIQNLNPAERQEYYRLMDRRIDAGLPQDESPAKFQDYTIPGGENYREILLKLPSNRPSIKNMGRAAYDEAVKIADQAGVKDFYSPHWDQPNVLAHARVSDRVGPNGEKILHIEEIQSDWHQQGRKKGYQNPELTEQLAEAARRRAEAKKIMDEAEEKVRAAKSNVFQYEKKINSLEFQKAPPEYQESIKTLRDRYTNVWMRELPEAMKARKAYEDLPDPQAMKTDALPDAPFKKNWHELTMKRLLNYAAENGYDRLAITPGAKQAERYDLSKRVERIEFNKNPDGTFDFQVRVFDSDNDQFDRNGATLKQVEEMFGKEIADRMNAVETINTAGAEDVEEMFPRELFGDGLKIGGEGMKGFYDKILPDYLNNYGKQYGAQVSEMRIPNPPKDSSSVIGYPFGEEYMQGRITWSEFLEKNQNAAQDFYVPLHSFDITPQMRQDITQKGLPLYQQVGIPTGIGATQLSEQEEPQKVNFSDNPDTMRLELMKAQDGY